MTMMATEKDAAPDNTTLQMVRAEINGREFQRWMGSRRLQDPDHAMHCLLKECFGELAPKPFRLIMPRDGTTGLLYGYGLAGAEALREAADICAEPLQARIIPSVRVDSKVMPSEWTAGKRLGFETRLRPTVRKARGSGRHNDEQDVFQHRADTYPKGEMPFSREQVYGEWLAGLFERCGGAALELEQTRLVAFQRVRSFRKLHSRYCEGPDAVMRGNLVVSDPAAFAQLLARGIGRHRAYGFGMLLLRPPGKPVRT